MKLNQDQEQDFESQFLWNSRNGYRASVK